MLWLWQYICGLVERHNIILGFLVALIGAIAAVRAVFLARKIFKDGLKINRNKVLDEFSLELVTEFIIPFSKLKTRLKSRQEVIGNSVEYSTVAVNEVYVIINEAMFQAEFPYFESHKGDIWDSLQAKTKRIVRIYRCVVYHIILEQDNYIIDDKQAKDYQIIVDFISEATRFCNGLKVTRDALYKYINGIEINKHGVVKKNKKKEHEKATVAAFYKDPLIQQSDKRFLKDGIQMMDKLDEKINNLPDRLRIDHMKSRLANDSFIDR
ncbi:MAG: hypothetical protein LUG99_10825 [Lachnospiraceae bacterium]|nr:hypothetical protein [Lachnospiraceae bacterium]